MDLVCSNANVSLSIKHPMSDVVSIYGTFRWVRLAQHICDKITRAVKAL